jgi:AraC-like DNA-binding protein
LEHFVWGPGDHLAGGPAANWDVSRTERRDVSDKVLDFFARHIYTLRPEKGLPQRDIAQVHVWGRAEQGFAILRASSAMGGYRLRRDAQDIAADSRDHYQLLIQLNRAASVTQFDRRLVIDAGTFALVSAAEPAIHDEVGSDHSIRPLDAISLCIPRAYIEGRVLHPEQICLKSYDPQDAMCRLAFEVLCSFQEHAPHVGAEEFEKSARAITDIVLLALSGSGAILSGEGSIRAANLVRVKRLIHRRLSDCDLTVSRIAREANISVTHLHNLFRGSGQTVREYLKEERLQLARTLFERSCDRRRSVTEVSFQCGFSSVAHFSRSFKSAFHCTPREAMCR